MFTTMFANQITQPRVEQWRQAVETLSEDSFIPSDVEDLQLAMSRKERMRYAPEMTPRQFPENVLATALRHLGLERRQPQIARSPSGLPRRLGIGLGPSREGSPQRLGSKLR